MPTLTRRSYKERRDCWHVYYGDVCVGTIGRRSGCPVDVDQWEWACGFYPGTEPGQREGGTAADFETCRVEFEAAWRRLLPTVADASFQEWRDNRDLTAWKIRHVGCTHEDADRYGVRPVALLLRCSYR
jgi:hypothetical protein